MIPKMDFRGSNYRSESYTSMIPALTMGDFPFPSYSFLPNMNMLNSSMYHPQQLGIPGLASLPPMQKPTVPPRGYNRNSSSSSQDKAKQQQQHDSRASKAQPGRRYKGASSGRSFDETGTQRGSLLDELPCDAVGVVGMDYMDPTKSYLGMKAKKAGRPRGVVSSNSAEGVQAGESPPTSIISTNRPTNQLID